MKKNSIIYLTVIGLISLFSGCKKDMTNVVISDSVVAPTIVTMPNLTLTRPNAANTLTFVGTPVDPGFKASATYILEACAHGNAFADALTILSQVQDTSMKITVADLNGILLKKFPPDQVSSVDFRIRSVLVLDAGTGYTPMVYISPIKTADVTPYGLPRLDLIGSGKEQKIESAAGDGKYKGFVKLAVANPFTLKDPDAGTIYGDNAGALKVNGTPIPVPTSTGSGWYQLSADTKALTYKEDPYMIGLVGTSTPNGWDVPDQKMDYDSKTGTWVITINLVPGVFKFRRNDGWAWNMGQADSGVYGELKQGGVGNDIPLAAAGNYTIAFTILNDNAGTFTIKKN